MPGRYAALAKTLAWDALEQVFDRLRLSMGALGHCNFNITIAFAGN